MTLATSLGLRNPVKAMFEPLTTLRDLAKSRARANQGTKRAAALGGLISQRLA